MENEWLDRQVMDRQTDKKIDKLSKQWKKGTNSWIDVRRNGRTDDQTVRRINGELTVCEKDEKAEHHLDTSYL